MSTPACLLFNESAHMDWVMAAIDLGFSQVMFTDDDMDYSTLVERVRQVVAKAHPAGVAVEGEISAVPGLSGELSAAPSDLHMTDPSLAHQFVGQTGVDVLAVNVGQAHLHGRQKVHLNLERLAELREAVPVPLVLHGSTSVAREDLVSAVKLGIRKINVGSILKLAYFEATREACQRVGEHYNPYQVVGSGQEQDILVAGRLAVQRVTEELMHLFGSAGRA
jgi:fructose/tagatose bisphosphate aldolase